MGLGCFFDLGGEVFSSGAFSFFGLGAPVDPPVDPPGGPGDSRLACRGVPTLTKVVAMRSEKALNALWAWVRQGLEVPEDGFGWVLDVGGSLVEGLEGLVGSGLKSASYIYLTNLEGTTSMQIRTKIGVPMVKAKKDLQGFKRI